MTAPGVGDAAVNKETSSLPLKPSYNIMGGDKWQPTPVFLPGESQGRGSLVGYHLWGHTESDTTEATYFRMK